MENQDGNGEASEKKSNSCTVKCSSAVELIEIFVHVCMCDYSLRRATSYYELIILRKLKVFVCLAFFAKCVAFLNGINGNRFMEWLN